MREQSGPDSPATPVRRRRSRLRWLRRIGAGLILLALGLLVVLHLPPVQRALVATALDALRTRQSLDISYSNLRFNLITRSVRVDDLRVGGEGASLPLVTAGRADVGFPFAAFKGQLDGLDVTLTDVGVNLIREDDVFVSVPAAWTRPSGTGGPRRLPAFAAIRLRNAHVIYEDRDAHFRSDTTNLSVDLLPTGSGEPGDLAGDLVPGARTIVRWEPRGTVLTLQQGRARFSPEGAGVDDLVLDAPEGRIASDVRFAFQGDDRFGLTAHAELSADQLAGWVDALETAEGTLRVDFTMPASGDAPAFADIVVQTPALVWRNLPFRDLDAAGALETGAVTLARVGVGLGDSHVAGSARLAWTSEGQSRASIEGRDLDIGEILRTLVPDSPAIARYTPGSLVGGRFEGTWRGWRAATLDGVADTTWRSRPGGLRPLESLRLDGRVVARFQRGPWDVDVDARVNGALDVDGRWSTRASGAAYSDWPLDGTLALAGSTPATILTGLSVFDTEPPVELGLATGSLSGTVALSGGLAAPIAAVDVNGTIAWPDQPEIEFQARTVVDERAITVQSFEAISGPSQASGTLVLDLVRDTLQGQFTATAVPVESWMRRFELDVPATGSIDATGRVSGPRGSYVLEADIDGGPIVAAGQAFDRLTGHVRWDGRTLDAPRVHATRGEGAVDGAVRWTRATGALDGTFDVTAVPFDIDVPGLPPPEDATLGRLSLQASGRVTLGGTADALRVGTSLTAGDVQLGTRSFGPLEVRTVPAEGTAMRLEIEAPQLGAAASGMVDLSSARPFDITARIDTDDSPLAASTRGVTLELDAMTLQAHVTGSIRDAVQSLDLAVERLAGRIVQAPPGAEVVDEPVLRAGDVTVTAPVEASASPVLLAFSTEPGAQVSYQPEALVIRDAALTAGQTRVAVEGTLGTPAGELALTVDGRLEDLRALALRFAPDWLAGAEARGPIHVQALASGPFDRPVISGTLSIDGAAIGDGRRPPLQDLWVRAALDGEQIRLDLAEAQWQGAHLALSGTIPTWFAGLPGSARTSAAASIIGHVDAVTLKVLEPFVPADALQATSFDSRLEFKIAATEPTVGAVTADLVVSQAVLRSADLGLAQRSAARLHLERGVLTIEPWTIGAPWSTATALTVRGAVTLPDGTRGAQLDLAVEGPLDLRAVGLLLGTYQPGGRALIDATITGPVSAPALGGVVVVQDGGLLIGQPQLMLADVNGTVRFSGDRLIVEQFAGSLNGGSVEVSGSMRQPRRGTPDGELAIAARGVLLEIPRGLRSAIDADLTFQERPDGRFGLGGTVTIAQAAYRETLLVTGGILNLITPSEDAVIVPQADGERPRWLVMDLRVVADDSIAIDTTYGRFNVGANLRVQGTPAAPRINGTVDIAPGGLLFFGGQRYQIESGRVAFRGASFLRPDVRLVAHTRIGGYDVTLNVETSEGALDTTLTSDPPLPEEDIASLVLSGQRRATGDPGELVTEQLFAALSGEIVGAVGRAIGFDSVRLEQGNPGDLLLDASLISSDSNPAQRLTFSKRVFPDLEVIVSQSLRESGDVTWVVSWEPLRNVELRFVQLDDRDRSYEARHDVSFGGGVQRAARRTRERRETVRSVNVEVRGGVTEQAVRQRLDIEQGDRFDFFNWQRDSDRLQEWLFEQGYFEARVTTRREPPTPPADDGSRSPVDVHFLVETGPPTAVAIDGIDAPEEVLVELARVWADVPVDGLLERAFAERLRPWLASQGYLQSTLALTINLVDGVKTATVHVAPGPRTTERVVDFKGNEGLSRAQLLGAVAEAGIENAIWVQPGQLRPLLLALYRRNGYLAADIDVLPPVFDGGTATLPVRIEEGPRFRAGTVRIEGVTDVPNVDMNPPVWEDAILTDRSVAEAVRELQRRFRRAGYRGTRVTAETSTRADGATVDLVFNVLLGQRLRLDEIKVAGNANASTELIERTLELERGEPISYDAIGRARDQLYDTGLFRTVDLELQPVSLPGEGRSGLAVASVSVEELPQYRLRYGVQLFDPVSPLIEPQWGEVDPGVVADLTRRGLFGRGITGGVGARLNASERGLRGYLSSRTFLGLPAQTNFFVSEVVEKTESAGNVLESASRGFTFDQRIRWRRVFQLGYGYNYERRVFDFLLDTPTLPFPIPIRTRANIGRVFGNLVLDDRDNVVDTRQGGFHSSSFELGPESLGSTLAFRKYLTQNFYFVPWNRVTFGSAARLELAGGPGRGLITTERLRVGGATTVRGYDDDTLLLQNVTDVAEGTTSILVLNQEVRFPLFGRITGATFWDYAHIYGELGEFTGLSVRNSVGGGLRVILPFIVLRVDYGYPLNQDANNGRGKWYFAIGQAF